MFSNIYDKKIDLDIILTKRPDRQFENIPLSTKNKRLSTIFTNIFSKKFNLDIILTKRPHRQFEARLLSVKNRRLRTIFTNIFNKKTMFSTKIRSKHYFNKATVVLEKQRLSIVFANILEQKIYLDIILTKRPDRQFETILLSFKNKEMQFHQYNFKYNCLQKNRSRHNFNKATVQVD